MGVAVKVTEVPLQNVVLLAAIVTEGLTELVVIVTALLFTVAGLAHGSLLVIDTVTTLPLARVVLVNVELVCPVTFIPLIIHW